MWTEDWKNQKMLYTPSRNVIIRRKKIFQAMFWELTRSELELATAAELEAERGGDGAEQGHRWCGEAGAAVGQPGRSGRAARRSGSIADLASQSGTAAGRVGWRQLLACCWGLRWVVASGESADLRRLGMVQDQGEVSMWVSVSLLCLFGFYL